MHIVNKVRFMAASLAIGMAFLATSVATSYPEGLLQSPAEQQSAA